MLDRSRSHRRVTDIESSVQMAPRHTRLLLDDADGEIRVAYEDGEGAPCAVGPRLQTAALGKGGRSCACELFPEQILHTDPIETALERTEQLALDRIYTGTGSTRDAAAGRAIVAWAAMTIQALADRVEHAIPAQVVERRTQRLIALAGGDAPSPLDFSEPPPIVEETHRSHRKRGIAGRIASRIESSRAQPAEEGPRAGRVITLQPFQNRWAIFYEIAASIAFTTFASAGSFVFLGVRLQKCTGPCDAGGITGFSASLDIIGLVICSFGFLFATLSYANATGVLARLSTLSYNEALERGNRVSEYFGVYPLIFAIPLAVESSTSGPIPLIVKLVGVVAFFGYHWSPRFSLLERVIAEDGLGSDRARRLTVLTLIGMLVLAWFGPSIQTGDGGLWIRVAASALFLAATCTIYAIAAITPEKASSSQYSVHREDFLNEESPSRDDLTPN